MCKQKKENRIPCVIFYFILFLFSFLGWGGLRLSPLGMSANICPIVPAPDDR
jgi:hypothetical protein